MQIGTGSVTKSKIMNTFYELIKESYIYFLMKILNFENIVLYMYRHIHVDLHLLIISYIYKSDYH